MSLCEYKTINGECRRVIRRNVDYCFFNKKFNSFKDSNIKYKLLNRPLLFNDMIITSLL